MFSLSAFGFFSPHFSMGCAEIWRARGRQRNSNVGTLETLENHLGITWCHCDFLVQAACLWKWSIFPKFLDISWVIWSFAPKKVRENRHQIRVGLPPCHSPRLRWVLGLFLFCLGSACYALLGILSQLSKSPDGKPGLIGISGQLRILFMASGCLIGIYIYIGMEC